MHSPSRASTRVIWAGPVGCPLRLLNSSVARTRPRVPASMKGLRTRVRSDVKPHTSVEMTRSTQNTLTIPFAWADEQTEADAEGADQQARVQHLAPGMGQSSCALEPAGPGFDEPLVAQRMHHLIA